MTDTIGDIDVVDACREDHVIDRRVEIRRMVAGLACSIYPGHSFLSQKSLRHSSMPTHELIERHESKLDASRPVKHTRSHKARFQTHDIIDDTLNVLLLCG